MPEQRWQNVPNQKLREARKARNWTQLEVADALGTTKLAVGRWERGECSPRRCYWTQLCELFGKTAVDLGLLTDPVEECSPQDISAAVPSYWNVPYRRNPFFICRDEVLRHLYNMLGPTCVDLSGQAYALSGLGASGKRRRLSNMSIATPMTTRLSSGSTRKPLRTASPV